MDSFVCLPEAEEIRDSFTELNRTRGRHTIAFSSMAGSQIITEPAPITYNEIAAWAALTGRKLNRFTVALLTMIDAVFIHLTMEKSSDKTAKRTDKEIGEYCKGESLDECKKQFGANNLKQFCRSCPD